MYHWSLLTVYVLHFSEKNINIYLHVHFKGYKTLLDNFQYILLSIVTYIELGGLCIEDDMLDLRLVSHRFLKQEQVRKGVIFRTRSHIILDAEPAKIYWHILWYQSNAGVLCTHERHQHEASVYTHIHFFFKKSSLWFIIIHGLQLDVISSN